MKSVFFLTCLAAVVTASPAGHEIGATIGQDVTLPCQAEDYMPFKVVEWSRPENNTTYVLVFYKQNSEPEIPEQSYKGRVELKNMKKGDVSLVLRNVNAEDSGTYECYVEKDKKRRKRDNKPISTVYLNVAPAAPASGRGHIGLILGLVVFALVVASLAAAFVWKKTHITPPPPSPPPPPHDEAVETVQVEDSGH